MGRKLLAVAVAVTTAAAAFIPAGAAQAAQPPSVPYAGSTQGDLGTLEIYVWAEAGVTSIRAQLFRQDTGERVATVTDFVLHEGTETAGLWRTPQPLQLGEMDVYGIAVEATDAAAGSVVRPPHGGGRAPTGR